MNWIKKLLAVWVKPEPQIIRRVVRVGYHPRKSPKMVIEALMAYGMTQHEIAAAVGTSQATISRVAGGEGRNTGHLLVDALRELLESKEFPDPK